MAGLITTTDKLSTQHLDPASRPGALSRGRKARRVLPAQRERAASPLAGYPHQNPYRDPAREHEGSAVAEKRQRNSGNRHQVQRHSDIYQHVHEPPGHQSECHETAVGVVGSLGDLSDAKEQPEEKRECNENSDKTELLAHDREDEIRVLLGKKRQPLLRTESETLARKTTGADRDLRLNDVIAGAPDVS